MVDIPVLLILAATVGAFLNVLRGISNAPKDPTTGKVVVDWLQILGGIILAVMASYASLQAIDVSKLAGPVATVVEGLLIGFATDFSVTKLKSGGS
jgi:uncharacterized membrane protein